MFSNSELLQLIRPLLLEQILMVTIGLADTFMVSGVSEAAVSSVSLVDSLNILILQILAALAMGGAVICGQYIGRKDTLRAKKCVAQLYLILFISTMAVLVLVLCLSRPILQLIFGDIDADVMDYAQTYFLITAISYPFMGIYNAGAALFRTRGDSKTSLHASIVMNLINVIGNAVLIYGFQLGVMGAAIATLIGRVAACIWIVCQQQKKENIYRIVHIEDLKPERAFIVPILKIGIPSGVENGMFQIGKLCVSSLTATLGTAAIAANAVANTVSSVANIPGNTMSLATMPVVSRCLGAREKEQAKSYAKRFLGIAVIGLAITNICMFLTIPYIATAFHLSEAARIMCVRVIRWFAVFSIFFWAQSFTMPNILRCGGDSRFTMLVSTISMWTFRVILSYIFVRKLQMGLLGVWLGMFIDWIFRGICFSVRFVSDRWMNHELI
ncbi:MAG: MATE family efflux transporter [Eubacterium sp.]|nr:MATE family efflux transporter [Eubacterium sp.]